MSGKRITITIKEDDDKYDVDEAVRTVLDVLEEAEQEQIIRFGFDTIVTDYPR